MSLLPVGFLAPGEPFYAPAGTGGGAAGPDIECSTLTVADVTQLYGDITATGNLQVVPEATLAFNKFRMLTDGNGNALATVDAVDPAAAVVQVRGLDNNNPLTGISTVLSMSATPALQQITFAQQTEAGLTPQFIFQKETGQHILTIADSSNNTGIALENGGVSIASTEYLNFLVNGVQPAGPTFPISSIAGAIPIPVGTVTPTDLTSSFGAIPYFDHALCWTDTVVYTDAKDPDVNGSLQYLVEGKTASYQLDEIPLTQISSLGTVNRTHNYRWLSTDPDDNDCVLQAFVKSTAGTVSITLKDARTQVLGPVSQ
jgi:hypothetical protein